MTGSASERRRPIRIAYWNNIPSPYFVERFGALADRRTVEFEGWFNAPSMPDRSWLVDEASWCFASRYLPRRRVGGINLSVAIDALREFSPDVLFSLYAEPSFMVGWSQARRRGVKTAFRVLAPSVTWNPRRRLKEVAKSYMFNRVDGLTVPGDDARAYVLGYGVPPRRVLDEPQVVDSDFFRTEASRREPDRDRMRANLGLSGTVFLYVGRLWWGKGLDYLIEAFVRVQAIVPDTSLLLVGDGVDEARLRATVDDHGLRNVVFAGFRQRDELPSFHVASDALVLPTLGDPYALVIDEAMAAGLPVISTTAVGEIQARVQPGVTGFTVPSASADALVEPMTTVATDMILRRRMGQEAGARMVGRTPALWAERIEYAARQLVDQPRLRLE